MASGRAPLLERRVETRIAPPAPRAKRPAKGEAGARERAGANEEWAEFAAWGGVAHAPGVLLRRPELAQSLGPLGFASLLADDAAAIRLLAPPRALLPDLLLVAAFMGKPAVAAAASQWLRTPAPGEARENETADAPAADWPLGALAHEGVGALGDAIARRQMPIVRALIDAGVDVNGVYDGNTTLLALCSFKDYPECRFAPLLLAAGADPRHGPSLGALSGVGAAAAVGDQRLLSMFRAACPDGFDFESALDAHCRAAATGSVATAAELRLDCERAARRESATPAQRDEKLARLRQEGFVAVCRAMSPDRAARQALGFLGDPLTLARGLEAAIASGRWDNAQALLSELRSDCSLDLSRAALAAAEQKVESTGRRSLTAAEASMIGGAYSSIALQCLEITARDSAREPLAQQTAMAARGSCPELAAWMERRALLMAAQGAAAVAAPGDKTRPIPRLDPGQIQTKEGSGPPRRL